MRTYFYVVLVGVFTAAFAQPTLSEPHWLGRGFVFDNDNQLFPASRPFVNHLGAEVFEKSGISVYIIALESLHEQSIESLENTIAEHLRSPYLYILFIRNEKKIDIKGTESLLAKISASNIYWDYIVPLIPKKDSELNPSSIAAFLLNGYIALVQELALAENIKLDNQYVPETKAVESTTRIILYVMTLTLLGLFVFVLLRKKNVR